MALHPQAALEQALLNLLRAATGAGGIGLGEKFSGRRFDGRPPPHCPPYYVSVWHDLSLQVGGARAQVTALDETYDVFVTVTYQMSLPFDRWVEHRDDMEAMGNRIRACVHKDVYNNAIANAANVLAEFRNAGAPDGTHNVGFYRGLAFAGKDALIEVGPEWFSSRADTPNPPVGITQRLRFTGIQRTQDLSNME